MALKQLGIEDCFDQIICFETMNPNLSKSTSPDEFPVLLKPSVDAMKVALRVADVDPRRTVSNPPLSRGFFA
jgi:putative hydrolase of the HAD superfamily